MATNKKPNRVTEVYITDEVMLMCHNLALLTEKEEVAALLIGEKIVNAHGTIVMVMAMSIPPRGEIKKDRVEILSEDLVNAMEDAKYFSRIKKANLNVIGWYHSHPHITVWPSNLDLLTQLNMQNMDAGFIGIICSSYNTDVTTMVREMKCVCFQAKQFDGFIHRIDIPFHVMPTHCNSRFSLELIIKHNGTLYDELENQLNRVNDVEPCPVAKLHNDSVYTVLAVHMLETVGKPMLQMFETQRDCLNRKILQLQSKLESLTTNGSDEVTCDGYDLPSEYQENKPVVSSTILPPLTIQTSNDTKKEKKSTAVTSPV